MKLPNKIILLCIAIILSFSPIAQGLEKIEYKVLILHSYHHGFQWTDDIMNGIDSVLKDSDDHVQMAVEYMDTKRHDPKEFFPLLHDIYKKRYQNESIDLIIVSDNNGLNFLLQYRDELFPAVPVVFCGVNNFSDAMIKGQKGITGVTEEMDIKATINLARRLNPQLRQIAVVNDRTPTGVNNRAKADRAVLEFKDKIEFIHLIDLTFEELQEKLKKLPAHSAVLLFTFHQDREGRRLELENYVPAVSWSAGVPTYALWKQYFGHGITGGVVLDGIAQGSHAAKIALKILHGESPGNIPVMEKSTNTMTLDYTQLKRFGIVESRIPAEAVIVNKPPSMYEDHKEIILTIIGGLLTLFLVVSYVFRMRAQRKLAGVNMQLIKEIAERRTVEEGMEKERKRLFSLLDTLPAFVYLQAPDYSIRFANRYYKEHFGETAGVPCYQSLWGRDKPCDICPTFKVFETGKHQVWEWDSAPDGCQYEIYDYPFTDVDGTPLVFELGFDITDRKKMEKQIMGSLEEKELLLREVHHRVKNNFQIINSLLRLQTEHIEDRQLKTIIEDVGNRIKSMSLVHEMLYHSQDMSKIDFGAYINTLTESLFRTYKATSRKIKIHADIDEITIGIDVAVPLGLVVNELILNAIKHAFSAEMSGEIGISLRKVNGDNAFEVAVSDNGVGLPEEFDILQTATLGLRLVVNIVEKQLGGSVEIKKDKGTEFRVRLSGPRKREWLKSKP